MIGISYVGKLALGAVVALPSAIVRVVHDTTQSPTCFEGENGACTYSGLPEDFAVTNIGFPADMWNISQSDPPAWQPEPWRGGRPPQGRRRASSRPPRPHRSKCGPYHRG